MTSLRGDGHMMSGDCMHYCQPGPIDTWNFLLMNWLIGRMEL